MADVDISPRPCVSSVADALEALTVLAGTSLAAGRGVDGVVPALLDGVRGAMGADAVTLLLVAGPQRYETRASCGLGAHVVEGVSVALDDDFAAQVIGAQRPARVDLDAMDSGYARLLREGGLTSVVATPLLCGGEMLGIMHAGYANPRDFTAEEALLFDVLAGWIALTLDRAALHASEEAARHRAEHDRAQLEFLAIAGRRLSSTVTPEDTLAATANVLVPHLADWSAVDVFVAETTIERRAVSPATVSGDVVTAATSSPTWDIGVCAGEQLRLGVSTSVPDLRTEEPLSLFGGSDEAGPSYTPLRLRTAAVVPIVGTRTVLGRLVAARSSDEPYSYEDLGVLEELGRRAGVALDQALLLESIREAERVQRELAQTLQASLLPPRLPAFPGVELAALYQPATAGVDVGGDFYDMFDTRGNRWGLVIGDVRGKGAEAAAVTALARYSIRAAAMTSRTPSRVLEALNAAILAEKADEVFCTAAYATFQPERDGGFAVGVALGGHPPPLLLRAGGGVERVGRGGTLLGLFPSAQTHDERAHLQPGDSLVFYTDGVTEARYRRDSDAVELFGEDRLHSVVESCRGLEAAQIVARIQTAVIDFAVGAARDDVAVVVVRVPAT